ncbi:MULTISPECIES: DUF1599 domain-containing protein [unclassified Capnocytophaga]|jgi:Domain of Unknown Function (DUF1599).|uniref:DUF1599 domain-containing protein n=1 Tax=unclassified Capnocytophaga TaxID=2640652 RepID=UPI000202DBC3|nr:MULTISPECIES: DUF1599 domain-containing protein [unclassified Capnocytophaga]EGD33867.1 hypothetical protein HMPREF9071_1584 [Capnocytophaga sp. oral taxon 338 str. F0234]MEB3004986.1 DUF1599 domain-containing protein [Capnocytophaga sp. G2]
MNTDKTIVQYNEIIAHCQSIFIDKMKDYGSAWRTLRLPSLTDQIFIKVQRIRTLQEHQERKIEEDETTEFVAVINYSLMALIQIEKSVANEPDLDLEHAIALYNEKVEETRGLMLRKNHDYGEAWRSMRISSLTDLIFQKILRIKQIEDNQGKTLISEGVKANYQDMINYAVFALILYSEKNMINNEKS